MTVNTVQTAFASTAAPASSLTLTLDRPTSVGNTLSLYLRFSPLTGTPSVSDSYGNQYQRTGVSGLSPTLAVAIFTADLVRGGAGHTLTVSSQGGPQTLEAGVSELSLLGQLKGGDLSARDVLLAILVQQTQTNAFLQRLVTAERA